METAERDPLKGDLGLVLKSKAKHSAIAAQLERPFVFANKPLVVQYEVLHQNGQECGGAYLKLLSVDPSSTDLRKLHDKTPYTIMFGPDKCGNDYKVQFKTIIFPYIYSCVKLSHTLIIFIDPNVIFMEKGEMFMFTFVSMAGVVKYMKE